MYFRVFAPGLVLAACCAAPVIAQSESDAICEVTSASDIVTVMVCKAGLSVEEIAAQARDACGENLLCGAWVWDDPALAPQEAPENHDLLKPEQVQSARGIWVTSEGRFIQIRKATD